LIEIRLETTSKTGDKSSGNMGDHKGNARDIRLAEPEEYRLKTSGGQKANNSLETGRLDLKR